MNEFIRNAFNPGSDDSDRELVIRQCEVTLRTTLISWIAVMILEYVFLGVALYRPFTLSGRT